MTSEVVLMNNKAVAVAADSVVTVAVEGVPRKTFTGVQKLFEISEGNPVAMMIYANAEIMGLPWKTVINNYIAKSKKLKFGTVKEYAEDFFKFIDKNTKLFPEKLQRDQYELMLKSVIHTIEARAQSIRNFIMAQENTPDENELIAIAINQIYDRVTLDEWDEPRKDLTCFPNGYAETLTKKYAKQIDTVISDFLSTYTLSESVQAKVRELPALIVTKHYFPQGWPYSGIVFAGYGKDQVHPEICSYEVSNVIGGYIKRGDHIFSALSNEEPVVIQPFAQDRMIRTLLYGIDPMLESLIIYKTFELVPRLMDQILGRFLISQTSRLRRPWKPCRKRIWAKPSTTFLAPFSSTRPYIIWCRSTAPFKPCPNMSWPARRNLWSALIPSNSGLAWKWKLWGAISMWRF